MFSLFRKSQSDALAPLVDLARSRHGSDRRVFLAELRRDAPTVASLVEALLASEEMTMANAPTPASASSVIRQEACGTVALSHVSSLSTTGG